MTLDKPANPEAERTYNAYKPVTVTDGVKTWTEHTFDNTVPWTNDDCAKFLGGTERLGPYERIEDMRAMLSTLPTDNNLITMHADAIRAIHAEVTAPPIGFTRERLDRLDQASEHWSKIMVIRNVMPLARQGARASKAQSDRAKGPRALTPAQQDRVRRRYNERVANGEKYGAIKALASEFDVSQTTIKTTLKPNSIR